MSAATRLHTAAPAHLPLIAVTTSEMRQNILDLATDQADPPRHEMVLGMRYLEAVGRAGALAIVVPPMPGPAIPALLDRVDGICLSGGPDINPDAYGAAPHPELGPTPMPLARYRGARLRISGVILISVVAVALAMVMPVPSMGNMAFMLMAVISPLSRVIERRELAIAPTAAGAIPR